jgi:hypothetical protein
MAGQTESDSCCRCSKPIIGKNRKPAAADEDEDEDDDSEDDPDTDDEAAKEILGNLTPCYHLYCPDCTQTLLHESKGQIGVDNYHHCSVCGVYQRFDLFELTRAGYDDYMSAHVDGGRKHKVISWTPESYTGPSTKVKALLNELQISAEETAALPIDEPPIRSVVFTEWCVNSMWPYSCGTC